MDIKSADLLASVAIYGLRDPRDGRVRYIGKAIDVPRRLKTHLDEASSRRSHKACWIRSLKALGLKPSIVVLEWVPVEHWQDAERAWIEYGLWSGWPLTNGTCGGDGGYTPASWSPEARAKRKARGYSRVSVEAMNAARRGGGKPPGSGSKPGQATSRGSQVGTSKLTELDVLRIRQMLADGVVGRQVALEFGVTPQAISYIRTGRTWAHVHSER